MGRRGVGQGEGEGEGRGGGGVVEISTHTRQMGEKIFLSVQYVRAETLFFLIKVSLSK